MNQCLSLLIMLSVIVFVIRIYSGLKKQHLFPLKSLTKIGTFHLFFLFIVYFYYFQQPFQFWIFSFLSLLSIPIFIFSIRQFHQHHFYSEFLRFVTLTTLHMQMGRSFLSACERGLAQGSWKQKRLMKHIIENVTFSQQAKSQSSRSFDQFIGLITQEMASIRDNQHQAIDRLCNLQKNLRDRVIFRHKSRQIWLYLLYQVGILSLIYWGLFLFVLKEFDLSLYINSFLLSLSFYFLGVTTLIFLARGKKWSI